MLTSGDFCYKYNEDSDTVTVYDEKGHGYKMQIPFGIMYEIVTYSSGQRVKDHSIACTCPKCGREMFSHEDVVGPWKAFWQCGGCGFRMIV